MGQNNKNHTLSSFHPYHQKIRDWQIEETLKWLHSLQSQMGGSCLVPILSFFLSFFLFWWQEFSIFRNLKIKIKIPSNMVNGNF
jgi:hypothetical protein